MKTLPSPKPDRVVRLVALSLLLIGDLALTVSAATVTWTGAGGDDSWHNPTNWSTLTVPGGADDAIISAALTVIHTNGGGTFVRSLQCATAFSILSGSVTVTDGASQVAGAFAMGINTALIASGPTAICTISNATLVDSANFAAVSGATLLVGGLTAYQKPNCNDVYWQAIGPGSRLTFPALLNLAGNATCGWLRLRATGGGKLELGAVTNVPDTYLETLADGENSLVDLSQLVSFQQFNAYAFTEARNGGEVRLTQLQIASRNHFTLRPGSTMTFPALTNADTAGFTAADGAVIELPLVAHYAKPACADAYFIATGAGSRLSFPALANLAGSSTCGWLRLRAQLGGKLELGSVTNIFDSYVDTLAEDTNSLVDLSGLRRMEQFDTYAVTAARTGGEVRLPNLGTSGRTHFTLSPAGILSFPALTNADSSGFTAEAGAVIELPLVANYAKPVCADVYFIANGVGSRLSFPALTSLAGNSTCGWLRLRAHAGGQLELNSVTSIADSYVDTLAEHTNSLIDLSAVVQQQSSSAYAVTEARSGGEVRLTHLRMSGRTHFTLGGAGVMTFPALTNADNSGFSAEAGAVLEVPFVTSYAKPNCADTYFIAAGAGSRLRFPALSFLGGSSSCGWVRLQALSGGSLELPTVTTIPNSHVSLYADGAGSVLSLPLLTGYDGANAYAIIEARNSGSILLPAATALDRILGLIVRDGGSITLTQLVNLTASTVVADNAVIDLNSVVNGGGTTVQEINGGDVLINPQVLPLTVTWTGAGGDNSWHNGTNWSTGIQPGPLNDVIISLSNAVVEFSTNAPAIRSLTCSRSLTLSGGTLAVSNVLNLAGGAFTLAGGTLSATNQPSPTTGTFVFQSGQILGGLRVEDAAIQFGNEASVAGTLFVHGTSTAAGNIPSNVIVRVEGTVPQGPVTLTWPESVTNFGSLILETTSNGGFDQSSFVTISTGALVNATSGLIQINAGQGERRVITGNVENWGTLTVQSNILLELEGVGPQFIQRAGVIQANGEFRLEAGRLEFVGGELTGLVRAQNSFITVADTVTSASTLRAVGGGGIFGGNLSSSVTVWIEGNIPYGESRLTITNNVVNRGRLYLETTSNGGFDQSCYLTIAEGAMLENDTGAVLESQPGAGEVRIIRGPLRNRGQILVGNGTEVDYRGTLESAGGTYSGLFFVQQSDLFITAPPTAPTTLLMVGSQNRLLTDNFTNLTLWVRGSVQHGFALLTLPESRTNYGVLKLETFSDGGFDQSSYLTINTGALVNATSGVIQVNRGAGESRIITGSLENLGTLNVQSNILLQLNGSGHRFTQRTGLVQADGEVRLHSGHFEFHGGTLTGLVRAHNSFIAVADTVNSTSTVRALGGSGVFGGNLSPTVTVWLEGEIGFGFAQLTVTNHVLNRGRFLMQTTSDGGFDQSCYLTVAAGGTFENDTGALLEAQPGAGEARGITGHLRNRGQILVGAGEVLDFSAGTLEAAGGTFTGDFYVHTSDVLATAPPSAPTTLMLVGGFDRLLTDIPTNLTLWVRGSVQHGLAWLTLPEGRTNHGTLRLETVSDGGFDQSCYVTISTGALVNAASGVIQFNQGAGESRTINGAVTNQGVFALQNITATMQTGPFVNDVSGLITGPGTINVSGISFVNNGTVSPGASPGLLSFTGNYVQGPAGQLNVEIAGTNVTTQYDRLAVSGSATLDGKLNVFIFDDFLPTVSNVFRVMTYGSVAGQFAELNGLNIYTNRSLVPAYLATAFDLTAIEATNVIVTKPSIVAQPASQTIINGQTATFRVTANGTRPFDYQWLFHGTNLPGANDDALVLMNAQTNQSGPYQVIITNSAGAVTSSIATLTVRPVADLVITDVTSPTNSPAGQPIQLTWLSRNQGSQSALASWIESVSLATNPAAAGTLISVANFTITNDLAAGQFTVRTQTVITPGGLDGLYYVVLTTDQANQVAEEDNETNNVTVATNTIRLRSPDLQPIQLQLASGAAVFGQNLNVSWLSTNSGSAAALSAWNDRVYLGTNGTSLLGATELATVAVTNVPLNDGAMLSNTVTVALPLSSQSVPGNYFVVLSEDHGKVIAESVETNNLAAAALTLTLPPLPDLAIAGLLAPANAMSGQMVPLIWAVTNRGNLGIAAAWRETVLLATNELGEGATELASFAVSNALSSGGSLLRTQSVPLPIASPLGSLYFAVRVDSLDDVAEESEANNLGVATNSTLIPAVLTLQLPANQLVEGSPQSILATVTRNGSRASALTVTITNGDPSEVSVTNEVVIPAGQASASFALFGLPDGIVDGPQLVAFTASITGFASATGMITVLDVDVPQLAVTLASNSVVEGLSLPGTVSRDAGTNNPVTVTIGTANTGQLLPPPPVTIPAGQFSAEFTLLAVNDTLLESPTTYEVTASATNHAGVTIEATVLDDDLPVVTLNILADSVSESAGPQATLATVTRSPVTARAVELDLVSSNPSAAMVPAQVTIPANVAQFSFPIAAVNNDLVDGPKPVTVSVWIKASGNGPRLAQGSPDLLTVTDDDGPTLLLIIDRDLVAEGVNPAATATVTRNTGTNSPLLVTLLSSDTSEVTVPANVTIPAGESSANFNLVTPTDGLTDGNQLVTVTASASSFTSGADQITVSDVNLPDLVVPLVTAPASAETEAFVNLGYQLRNQGLLTMASNTVTQRILLSTDPVVGDDLLLGQFEYSGPLPPGDQIAQTFQIRMPQAAGDYWVVIEADAAGVVSEILEDNNTGISMLPIHLTSEYEAEVATTIDSAPSVTVIPLTGRAFRSGTGGGAPFKLVNIHIKLRDTRRIIAALTDANGNFSTSWQPLPGEAGFYEIAAAHPGTADPATQDTFSLFGMKAVPAAPSVTMVEQSSVGGLIQVINSGDLTLTGLQAEVINKPANLNVTVNLQTNVTIGLATNILTYDITALNASIPQGEVLVRVTSTEGAVLNIPIAVKVDALVPRLVASPAELVSGMKRGAQTFVSFAVANVGGTNSGPISVSLPTAPWLGLISPNPLPALAPGQTNVVTLSLMPAADQPLQSYSGNLLLNAGAANLSVPFEFRALSEAKGDLLVRSVDEFTFFAEGAPPLTNARVVVRDQISDVVVTNGVTDTNGHFFVPQLMEGYYEIEVTADRHVDYRNVHLLHAGQTNDIVAFLSRQTVRYTWNVEPTEIEDRYTITLETEFEANVPAPVVTVEPSVLDVSDLTTIGQVKQVNLTLRNHGLIAVDDTRISFGSHPFYEIVPLIEDVGHLAARSSLTVPVTMRRIGDFDNHARPEGKVSAASHGGGIPCGFGGSAVYSYVCGTNKVNAGSPVAVGGVVGNCPGGSGFIFVLGGIGGPGLASAFGGGGKTDCTPPDPCWLFALGGCIPGPVGCGIGGAGCFYGAADGLTFWEGVDCAAAAANCLFPPAAIPTCVYSLLRCAGLGNSGGGGGGGSGSGNRPDVSAAGTAVDPLQVWKNGLTAQTDLVKEYLGGDFSVWLNDQVNQDTGLWFARFRPATQLTSDAGRAISPNERTDLLTGILPPGVPQNELIRVLERWNRSTVNWSNGIMTRAAAPPGANLDFIDQKRLSQLFDNALYYQLLAEQEGYASPINAMIGTYQGLAASSRPAGEVKAAGDVRAAAGEGVCARVRLRIDQSAILTREAFRATLEFDNSGDSPLEDISVALRVTDAAGNEVTGLFGIRDPELNGLSDVNGGGFVPAGASATARWILVPTVDAAPAEPVTYFVSGTINHTLGGTLLTIPLSPVGITVHPTPILTVRYFHERDVFSDDPHTDAVEPSVPFNLAVMVENHGAGEARNFRITSGQPEIIENEKGLLVDFKIIATEVSGQNLTPSLTANFGNISAGQTAIARWLMTSTLQGLFIDYSATFEHVDGLGNPRLSLIDSVEIHEMNRLVQASGAFEDGKPDFLVNDLPDLNDYPDTLWFSDGAFSPVEVVTAGTINGTLSSGNFQVTLTAPLPGGWAYLRIPDPGNGQYILAGVVRSDNTPISANNVWVTDRTFIGQGKRPIRENNLHLLDYNSTGSYTLIYEPNPDADSEAPSSAVAALPANSKANFSVAWSGQDNAGGQGVAFFDVYVSEDGGSFQRWLWQTLDTTAIYQGNLGRSYAFYSVAVDRAGNREATPPIADAQTSVTITNHPPVLGMLADVTMNEGETLLLTIGATDPDADELIFSLLTGAPVGLTINPYSGLLTWVTGESHGPSTNPVSVQVLDNGAPRLGVFGGFNVIVLDLNTAPVLAAIANRTISEGQLLTITNVAQDFDQPPQKLTYRLGPNPPAGATINTNSGLFSWRPSETQGGTTNVITVIVSDDGSPVGEAMQTFTVIVRDTRADFVVSVGSTNLLVGANSSVPVRLDSGLDLTNLTFVLEADAARVLNLLLTPLAPEVTSATLSPAGPNRSELRFRANPAAPLLGKLTLGRLDFAASTNPLSSFVPLRVSSVQGSRTLGEAVTNAAGVSGTVVMIGDQSLLLAHATTPRTVTLYARPATCLTLLTATNLTNPVWLPAAQYTLTEQFLTIPLPAANSTAAFYRAVTCDGSPALLWLRIEADGSGTLIVNGQPGLTYGIEQATNLPPAGVWQPWTNLMLTDPTVTLPGLSLTNPATFFRAVTQ